MVLQVSALTNSKDSGMCLQVRGSGAQRQTYLGCSNNIVEHKGVLKSVENRHGNLDGKRMNGMEVQVQERHDSCTK